MNRHEIEIAAMSEPFPPQSYEYRRASMEAPDVMYALVGIVDQIGKRHWFNVISRMGDMAKAVMNELRKDLNP